MSILLQLVSISGLGLRSEGYETDVWFLVTAKERKKKEEKERKERKKEEQKAREKADDPKAGADVGKIVNLMAGDANKVNHNFAFVSFLEH